jgi:hypothetical protein
MHLVSRGNAWRRIVNGFAFVGILASANVHAAPPRMVAVPLAVPSNDGFIVLDIPSQPSDQAFDSHDSVYLSSAVNLSGGRLSPLVPVQVALDKRLGVGKAKIVGYAPVLDPISMYRVVVFYRYLQDSSPAR